VINIVLLSVVVLCDVCVQELSAQRNWDRAEVRKKVVVLRELLGPLRLLSQNLVKLPVRSTGLPYRNGTGRQRLITPPMLAALCDHLLEKPRLYRNKMAVFLYDDLDVPVSVSSIGRALASIKWTKR
jgi:hypothetical protein